MKYGVRDVCDVVFKAKNRMTLGSKIFFKDEPVIYFDTLTTSTLEGTGETTYARGGRGNSRLMSWDGEREVTFTMEDALISPEGLAILAGADLIDASADKTIKVHTTEDTTVKSAVTSEGLEEKFTVTIPLKNKPYGVGDKTDTIYVFPKDASGNIFTEPFIPTSFVEEGGVWYLKLKDDGTTYTAGYLKKCFTTGTNVLVDYYVEHESNTMQINIAADQFGSNFYIEASTLFRDEKGQDHAAEFIIPNGRIQSNFSFNLSATGDPSTFTFTVDAFPGEVRFGTGKKVLAAIQVLDAATQTDVDYVRDSTKSNGGTVYGSNAGNDIDTNPEGPVQG